VKSIVTMDGELDEAIVGQSVTLCLEDEIDISRGDVICAAQSPAEASDQFEVTILWMAEDPMLPGRSYAFKAGAQLARATITSPKFKINVNTLEKQPAKNLELNEIGECNIAIDRKIVFDPYEENRDTGSFILIDRFTNATVGMGMIRFALRRASNIHWQAMDVSKVARSRMKNQKPVVLWFTGLSGSGKSTIANLLEKKLSAIGKHTFTLDGDNVRHGLNRDLGFTDADRVENIRRVTEVAKLMTEAGIITLISFISPFRSERRMARQIMQDGEFLEIFVDTPLEVAEARDVKGLYKKARAGEIKNFTGIDSPYEPPETAEITVNTVQTSAEEAADHIIVELEQRGILESHS
jgi:bifunctional enzyme CysN/CysC